MSGNKNSGKSLRRRTILKPERVISLLNLPKIDSAQGKTPTQNIVYPPPPSYLNVMAKAEWKRIIRKLHELNRFVELDGLALSLYCQTFAEFVTASEMLKKSGKSLFIKSKDGKGLTRNPWGDELKRTRKEMSSYLALFGLSPYDRARLTIADGDKLAPARREPNAFDGM